MHGLKWPINSTRIVKGGPVADGQVFKYQLLGTWGYSPKVAHWIRFTAWARDFKASGKPTPSDVPEQRGSRSLEGPASF